MGRWHSRHLPNTIAEEALKPRGREPYLDDERSYLMFSRGAPNPSKTLPLSVANMGFMLDRLGRDCAPLQYLRELTQNSIEAILRLDPQAGEIQWDVDWNRFDLEGDGIYKLAIIDTGDGMTGPEMVKYINQLSSSIAEQSFQGNYGIGAKISAATRNHDGLIYLSWKDGEGSMIHLWKDPDSGEYGLRQFEHPDGSYDHWIPIEDSIKPELINDHGTMVILLGNSQAEHTMHPPPEAASPSRWIAKHLNTRYFDFPEGITIKAREGWENPRTDTDRNLLRTLTGQKAYLDDHSISSGSVGLVGGTAHWWILKDEPALGQNSGFVNSSGHIAAFYKNEHYEVETARSGVARLQHFGVIFGYRQVVIYIEPQEDPDVELTTNTARTHLLLNGEPLPWAEWASDFRESMPQEIVDLIEEVAAGARSRDHTQSIRDRLKQIRDLFKLSRYRPMPLGDVFVEDEIRRGGNKPIVPKPRNVGPAAGRSGTKGGRAGDVYAVFATERGQAASAVDTDPYPEVMWVSASDGTREPGFLDDRAATYLADQNLLQINADFRVFKDMAARYMKLYGDIPGAEDVIEETVHEWFEQTLVEAVIGVQALEGAREWSIEDIDRALSEVSLSSAVMPRYHIDFSIKRSLGSKLGSLKEKATAA